MNLREYFDDTGIKISRFAEKFNITERTLYNVLKGHDIALSTAIQIEEATAGKVKCKDLRPSMPKREKRPSQSPLATLGEHNHEQKKQKKKKNRNDDNPSKAV